MAKFLYNLETRKSRRTYTRKRQDVIRDFTQSTGPTDENNEMDPTQVSIAIVNRKVVEE